MSIGTGCIVGNAPLLALLLPDTHHLCGPCATACRDGGLLASDRALKINPTAKMQELQLQNVPPTNAREFRHPLTLLRLAQFVRDATKVRWGPTAAIWRQACTVTAN